MRDFLEFDHEAAKLERAAADPIAKARALNRQELPKKFYTAVSIGEKDGHFVIELDGRPVKTPAKRSLAVPARPLAEAIAAEWAAQETHIDPSTMPHTRMANSVIDGVADRRAEVIDDLVAYAGSDLLCYRAEGPDRLVERQTLAWDPVLDWAEEALGARFLVAEGVMHIEQDPEAIARIRAELEPLGPFVLGGMHAITTLTGSVLIALALRLRQLDASAGWAAGALEDLWSLEIWGHDDEAAARLERRQREFQAAMVFVGLE